LTLTQVQLFPKGAEKVPVAGQLALDPASDGIDPAADGVTLRLFGPTGARIWPVSTDFNPVFLAPTIDGWAITAAEQARTGIQSLYLIRTGDPGRFDFGLVDTATGLPAADYSRVRLTMKLGNDLGAVEAPLVQRNGNWTLS
jgi:hypothetical protein